MPTEHRHSGKWVDQQLIPCALIAVVPLFWFPWHYPLLTLLSVIGVLILLIGRMLWQTTHSMSRYPLTLFTLLLICVCLATVPVIDWRVSLPKLLGMLLGVLTVVVVGNAIRVPHDVGRALLVITAAAAALIVVAIVGMEPSLGEANPLASARIQLAGWVSRVLPIRMQPIHPNEVAGAFILLIPLLLSQALVSSNGGLRRAHSLVSGALGFISVGMVISTDSRGGIVGMACSLALFGAVLARAPHLRAGAVPRSRAMSRLLLALYVLTVGVLAAFGTWTTAAWLRGTAGSSSATSSGTLASRLELWDRATLMLQDFPMTGIGIGQYDVVLHALYVGPEAGPTAFVPHAHSFFLQFALELGITGGIALLALLTVFFARTVATTSNPDRIVSSTGLGAAAGMFGFLIYGLTDALAPGARGGLVFWIVLALGLASSSIGTARSGQDDPSNREILDSLLADRGIRSSSGRHSVPLT